MKFSFLRYKRSFFVKQIEIYILLIILVVIIIGVVTNYVIIDSYKNQTLQQTVSTLRQLNTDLESSIKKINDMVQLINIGYNNDSSLLYDLIAEDQGNEINNISAMEKFYILSNYIRQGYDGINSVFIISAKERVFFDGKNNYLVNYNFLEKDWFKQIANQKGKEFFVQDKDLKKDYMYNDNINLLTFGKNIFNPDELWDKRTIATLLVNIDSTFFSETINRYNLTPNNEVFIINANGNVIYNRNTALVNKPLSFYDGFMTMKKDGEVFKLRVNGKNQIISHFTSETSGWTFLVLMPESQLNKGSDTMRFYFIIIIIVYIIIGFIVSVLFARRTSSHIKNILVTMEEVEKGNLDVAVEINSGDELSLISNGLNKMVVKIKKYILDIYQTEAMKRDAELYALKSQTDPHFLFNMLEVVRMRVLINGDRDTAEMIKILGKFYYDKLDYGEDLIDLKAEIDLVYKYIHLERYRRTEKIEFVVDVKEEFLNCKIPVFSFQPIIENILRHGVVKGQDIGIRIKAAQVDDKLEITVSDNGKGIENVKINEIIKELDGQVFKKSYKHIGIKNVNYRLKLYFGVDFGITMDSIYGEGTSVKLYLPIVEGETAHV